MAKEIKSLDELEKKIEKELGIKKELEDAAIDPPYEVGEENKNELEKIEED